MQICPSILEPTVEDLLGTIKRLSPYYNYFQIDIADGIYVDNKTASLDDFIKLNNQLTKLPSNLVFDFHLMVRDFETDIKKLYELKNLIKIKNILIHYDLHPNYSLITSHYPLFNIGLTLNPQDQVADLANHYPLNTIQCLQIMSVVPGVQGNPFLPDTLKKIEQIRVLGYKSKIFLDGAVNDWSLPFINEQKFRPDVICPGSFLTKAKDLKKNVEYLKKFVKL